MRERSGTASPRASGPATTLLRIGSFSFCFFTFYVENHYTRFFKKSNSMPPFPSLVSAYPHHTGRHRYQVWGLPEISSSYVRMCEHTVPQLSPLRAPGRALQVGVRECSLAQMQPVTAAATRPHHRIPRAGTEGAVSVC